MEEFKKKQLEILHELDRVCAELGVNYYLAYGTCLGAIRHHGFIPWDDDIDVFLLYSDMNRLIDSRSHFGNRYFLQGIETEESFTLLKHNLRDSSTSYFTDKDDIEDINHGMYIDLYTLYPYPDNPIIAHKLIIDAYICMLLCRTRPPLHHGIVGRMLYRIVHAFYPGKMRMRKIEKVQHFMRENGGTRYYATFFGDDITPLSCIKFPQELFGAPTRVAFEDYEAPCPSDPHEACRVMYGSRYMQFPPEEERTSRHSVRYMSCTRPYTDFIGIYYQGEGASDA